MKKNQTENYKKIIIIKFNELKKRKQKEIEMKNRLSKIDRNVVEGKDSL